MRSDSTSVDIVPYLIRNMAPDIYEFVIVAEDGNSNRVKVNLGGTGVSTSVDTSTAGSAGANPPPAAASFTITFTHFTPMKGTPGPSGYIHPRLIYTITASVDMAFPPINFAVDSAAFTDPNTVTASGPASYPSLRLFEKQEKSSGSNLKAGESRSRYVDLDATSDSNWFLAYGKTENATFRWSVPGQAEGSEEHPVQKAWP
jgi:hypothetical protein